MKLKSFEVSFETDNAAFDGFPETEMARILREIACKLECGIMAANIRDVNGNSIGAFRSIKLSD